MEHMYAVQHNSATGQTPTNIAKSILKEQTCNLAYLGKDHQDLSVYLNIFFKSLCS